MSRNVALTGGIASGKSTVSGMLSDMGAVIIDSDLLAREVVEPGTPSLAAITERFGPEIVGPDGRLDRAALGEVVFADPQARADLEAIVHPAIRARSEELVSTAAEDSVIVHVIPLLFEKDMEADFDAVIVVDTATENQVARMRERDGLSDSAIESRLASQASRQERLAGADFVVDNNGPVEALRPQVAAIWRSLQEPVKFLPVPELPGTMGRFLRALEPLLDDETHRAMSTIVDEFESTEGPELQRALVAYAERENAAGRSWLARTWLSGYLGTRDPLPLSSNVGFQIRVDSENSGVERAAEMVMRFAAVHLAHIQGQLEPAASPRGERMDDQQCRFLAGGVRHPVGGMDETHTGPRHGVAREIGLLWRGDLYAMPVTDESGELVSLASVVDVLASLTEQAPDARPEGQRTGFTDVSYPGGDASAELLDRLLEDPRNQRVYSRLDDMLFLANLIEEAGTDTQHLRRTTFCLGQAWAYKPVTYQIGLADDYLAIHVEHSTVDGATIKGVVAEVQKTPAPEGSSFAASTELLEWTMPEGFSTELQARLQSYREAADAHQIRIVEVPFPEPAERLSHDALQQWLLLYGQLAAFGEIRSTYEAVDMREFQAGRTECLRPVTVEAVTLVRHLLAGDADIELVREANRAHRDQVIACKTGQAIDRHLLGLASMARERVPELFSSDGYRRLTTDFLSTTSVGDQEQIVRFGFAPTSEGGIGVNYTKVADGYEFCLSYRSDQCPGIDRFVEQVRAGAEALARVIAQ